MAGDNVRNLVGEFLGQRDEPERLHIQTVKITERAHAKLRALADLTDRSKTPVAADLLMAAIDDAIAALPNDPMDEAVADKLRGVTAKLGTSSMTYKGVEYRIDEPRGLRDIVLERADNYLAFDEHERFEQEQLAAAGVETVSKNGVHK